MVVETNNYFWLLQWFVQRFQGLRTRLGEFRSSQGGISRNQRKTNPQMWEGWTEVAPETAPLFFSLLFLPVSPHDLATHSACNDYSLPQASAPRSFHSQCLLSNGHICVYYINLVYVQYVNYPIYTYDISKFQEMYSAQPNITTEAEYRS